ncbi:MAG: hypothetical protein RBS34_02770 [Desulfofustis sp.]|jgi:hypothetical protein|nr:hypothetical protein [Desulfofustis sp.]
MPVRVTGLASNDKWHAAFNKVKAYREMLAATQQAPEGTYRAMETVTSYRSGAQTLEHIGHVQDMAASYALDTAAQETANELIDAQPYQLKLLQNHVGYTIQPGSVLFEWAGNRYIDRLGKLYRNPDPVTGLGALAGQIDYSTGLVTLDVLDGGSNTIEVKSLTGRIGNQLVATVTYRTPGAPIRPGSLSIIATTLDGQTVTGSGGFDGYISGNKVRGAVDYETGIVVLDFGEDVFDDGSYIEEDWYYPEDVDGEGYIFKPLEVFADSITYTCVVYSYIPLNADLIGLDPVRLPSDGRVPIVKTGDVIVVHNTQNDELPNPLSAGQEITLSRIGVASVELYDTSSPPLRVPSTKYTFDKDAQLLTMADPLDLTGFTLPLICSHRVEDMALVSGVQINGQLTVASGLQNSYPVAGTYVSSALLFGDLQARAFNLFDQKTWSGVWSDDLIGDATSANYNEINYPVLVTNSGAVKERWALVFDSAEHFQIIGEKYGVVADGYIYNDCQPVNPATNQPFFFIDYRGWGAGWATGNVLRFNTDGANHDLWIARTTLQGPAEEPSDQFTLQIRGDAE